MRASMSSHPRAPDREPQGSLRTPAGRARSAATPAAADTMGRRGLMSSDTVDMSSNSVNGGHLRAFIERIEKLEEEKRAIADDIKDVYGEAKGTGFDPKIMRKIVSLRRQDKNKRQEEEEILDLYLSALGDV
jgi:uncharacterized protein (UPF0335 family)